ncbi:GntR family transcriptional regulator [Ammoniphilus sp. YIM 78166]|uniref:GntR family transcriptional regulator n=1 Tax=Ammoniphilus sp. YIM 78166 TaxID=1644106 RepID=UPI00106F1A16|nr:GntR family transcriptional regulator [Ammoniphilus sp. YIM 78166]
MSDYSIEKRSPYYEQFYHSIKKMIFEGKFKPGERINETQLAKEFNVSKSPVREAIRVLEKEGLVIVDEKSRVLVYEPTMRDVEEIYYCRMALESFAVRSTTKIATEAEIKEIETTLAKTEQAIQNGEESNVIIALNDLFHHLILEYTQNRRLQKQWNDLKSLTYLFRILNFQGEDRATIILKQHRGIFHYMKSRDQEAASKAMIDHLQCDLEHLLQVISHSTEQVKP